MVYGLGCRVQSVWFGVLVLPAVDRFVSRVVIEFRVEDLVLETLGCRVYGASIEFEDLGFLFYPSWIVSCRAFTVMGLDFRG